MSLFVSDLYCLRSVLMSLFVSDLALVCSVPGSIATVLENQPAGTLVLIITAEPDVTFHLQANPGNFFRLQGAHVVVNTPLDFEVRHCIDYNDHHPLRLQTLE